MTKNVAVLISGSGSNLQALIDAEKAGILRGRITEVVSSSQKAYGLERASQAGIPTKVHSLKQYYELTNKEDTQERSRRRERFNKDLANLIINGAVEGKVEGHIKPDLIVCAGWMLILSPMVLQPLEDAGIMIINLHPALPGAFDGIQAIERAWEAGQKGLIKTSGVMIHKVIVDVDRGAPIVVKEVPINKEEKLEDFENRIHEVEHSAIVEGTNRALLSIVSSN